MSKVKNILFIFLLGYFIFSLVSKKSGKIKVVKIPEVVDSISYVEVEKVIKDTVYLPSDTITVFKDKLIVDKEWKEKYELAKDSLHRLSLYLQAIQIKEYDNVFLEDDKLKLEGKITTRGSLLGYNFKYTIKESEFSYKPEVEYMLPKLTIGLGIESNLPLRPSQQHIMKANLFINRGSISNSISYDTRGVFWVGFTKNFKIY